MATVAELRMDVDSRPVEGAVKDLDRLENQSERTERATDDLSRSTRRAGRSFEQTGKKAAGVSRRIGGLGKAVGALAARATVGAAAFAGLAAAAATFGTVRVGAGFEEQMSAVLAVTQATGAEFDTLSAKARELGATTVFSAREAAEGMEFLARAGFDANQIVGALPGTLNLAAAGALDLGRAADIASNVLTGFGLAAEEAVRVSDVLAKAAASSNTNVEQLGEGLKLVAPVAAGLGVSLEETISAISKLSDAGLQASVAGTGLRRVLSDLASPSDDLSKFLGGVTLEADGFLGVMEKLATESISTADAIEIFGQRGGPAFAVLIEQFRQIDSQGVTSLERMAQALQKADGFAERTAETMTDNFNGAVKEARSALDELFIVAAKDGGALEGLTGIVDALTDALRSDAAKEFAESFGQAMRDASLATLGLIEVLKDVEEALRPVAEALEVISRYTFAGQLARQGNRLGGSIREDLISRGADQVKAAQELRGVLEAQKALALEIRAANDNLLSQNNTNNLELGLAPGIASELSGVAGAYDELSLSISGYEKAVAGAKQVAETQKATIGDVEKALRKQLAVAERLEGAAQGGVIQYEIELSAVDLESAAEALVDKAREAGEDLSLATAQMLLRRIDDLEKSTDALLEAEKALRERAADRSEDIAAGLQGRIDEFTQRVGDTDPLRAGLDARPLLEGLERSFQALVRDIEESSLGLNPEQLKVLYEGLEAAGEVVAEKWEEAAERGGLGIAARIRAALDQGVGGLEIATDSVSFVADLGSQVFESIDGAVEAFKRAGSKSFEAITALAARIGTSLENGLNGLGEFIGGKFGDSLEQVGGVVGAASAVAQLVSSAVKFFKNIFGGGSALTFDFNTGAESFRNKGKDLDTVKDLGGAFTQIAQEVAALLGGGLNSALGVRFRVDGGGILPSVRNLSNNSVVALAPGASGVNDTITKDPEEAFRIALQLVIDNALVGADEGLASLASGLLEAGRSIDGVVGVLEAVQSASASGQKRLSDFALAAANAGLSAEQITSGVQSISNALSLVEKPLSNTAKGIRQIKDAIDPAVAALKSAGQAFGEIEEIGRDAIRQLGLSFVDGVRDLNLRLRNETLADYRGVLDEIAQRQNDAFALLQEGGITQSEFDFVQSTGGLQAAQFFKGLDQEARDNLAAYLGVLGDVSGDIAVARARLEEQFDYLVTNVEDTARSLEETARTYERLGQGLRQTADSIRTQFSGLNPRASVDDLLGRVATLRSDGLEGNVSALQALPQVVTSLVESARQAFGGTAEFARIRDIGLSALDDTAGLAEQLAKQNFEEAENARSDVELLADIRNLIDDDRQLNTLQGILDSGRLTNQLIADQIQSFVDLFGQGGRPANEVSIEELQEAANRALAEQQATQTDTRSQANTAQTPLGSSSSAATDTQIAVALAENATATDRLSGEVLEMRQTNQDLADEINRLVTRLAS